MEYKVGKYETKIKYDVHSYSGYEIIFTKKISENEYQNFYLRGVEDTLVLDFHSYCKTENKKIYKVIYKTLLKEFCSSYYSETDNVSIEDIKKDEIEFCWFFEGNKIIKKVLETLDNMN